jgi:hypothetical protein
VSEGWVAPYRMGGAAAGRQPAYSLGCGDAVLTVATPRVAVPLVTCHHAAITAATCRSVHVVGVRFVKACRCVCRQWRYRCQFICFKGIREVLCFGVTLVPALAACTPATAAAQTRAGMGSSGGLWMQQWLAGHAQYHPGPPLVALADLVVHSSWVPTLR